MISIAFNNLSEEKDSNTFLVTRLQNGAMLSPPPGRAGWAGKLICSRQEGHCGEMASHLRIGNSQQCFWRLPVGTGLVSVDPTLAAAGVDSLSSLHLGGQQ